ncbi:MAG: ABC transporter ATP-binding protein [Chloroflexi bacterium]|nr:MAG: ABC transporter ATP-binding protein [Chloroflexota bacterium]
MITVNNLDAGYGKLVVLHDVSMTFEADKFTTILGANGSGKSTLLKSIMGLTTIVAGSVTFDGRELVGMATESISDLGIAYVPQRENIFDAMSVRENLQLAARRMSKDEARRALHETYDLFPILAKRQSQRAGQLSGGERQMVAIAIGWLSRPRLMILDEPSAGLAPLVAKEVFEVLRILVEKNITMIVVEQNARRAIKYCDYVYVLRSGEVAFNGTAEACLANEEMVKTYLSLGRVENT